MEQSERWAALVEAHLRERIALRELGRRSVSNYRSTLHRFVADADQLDRAHVVAWLEANRALAPGTMRTCVGQVRKFTSWCVARGHLDLDPMLEIATPKVPRAVPRAIAADQIGVLWRELPDARARLIIALAVGLGLRRAEIAGLELGDWDPCEELVVVRHQSKGGHQRALPVPAHVTTCIRTYLGERPTGAGPLIRSRTNPTKGVSAQQVGRLVTDWLLAAGVKGAMGDGCSTHALRHSFAQLLYRQGGDQDLRLVQVALGHSQLASTEIYMRSYVDTDRLRRAMSNVAISDTLPPAA